MYEHQLQGFYNYDVYLMLIFVVKDDNASIINRLHQRYELSHCFCLWKSESGIILKVD